MKTGCFECCPSTPDTVYNIYIYNFYRPSFPSQLFYTWETFLQEVETDSKSISDVASVLGRQISRPLLDRSFYRKVQSRKVFGQRDSLEVILQKAEDKLGKVQKTNQYSTFNNINNEMFLIKNKIKCIL